MTLIGVVLLVSTDDVAEVVAYCADRMILVLPRGGGTSLAGQAVNETVILADFDSGTSRNSEFPTTIRLIFGIYSTNPMS
jgi:FAD/FMN-containing dehydrogenase